MKRRDFFIKGAIGAIATSIVPISAIASTKELSVSDKATDNWVRMADGKKGISQRKEIHSFDVAVLGGGLAGICAAVAAARNGSKTVLVQDRSVLGGNSSSEMRVHVHGVTRLKPDNKPERETGILEEILLHNRFCNPQESFYVWDHVLYDFVSREPNLKLMLNTQAIDAVMDGSLIKAARCHQLTTEKEITLNAKQFIDCSGDGLLAATSGAEYRTGREGKAEFNEKYAPDEPDGWQMGATLLWQAKDMGKPIPYEAPPFAIKYEAEKSNPKRNFAKFQNGIWWIEIGSENDIIGEAEEIRHKLMGYLHGVWDYIKNSGKFPEAENMALDWVGSIPGRRESRRFMGDFILSEKDLLEHRHFSDAVAYGGWSLDEHCWAGIENLQDPPSYFHEHFHEIYEIPFRSLYSKNISNLFFAGRNISQTHIALSSSRVMGTCSLEGQAAGTAANLCVQKGVNPREIYTDHINELQENLLRDDAFIPNRPANDSKDLAKRASLIIASSTISGDAKLLSNGMSRDFKGEINHWQSDGLPANIQVEWKKPVSLSKVEIKCDTNLKRNIMMLKESLSDEAHTNTVPKELLKSLKVEARVNGEWIDFGSIDKNKKRLIKFQSEQIKTTAIRVTLNETYGVKNAKLFEIRCYKS
ncbi:FAD-binding dehydrogenase [Labilibaculum filiforme]|uniref:FAD-binding dehydrogenase n=1 Tax=Labilibaculum filiforme TaxID=1940526 RepID=A0A2N3HSK0_9BACT|nr:FAD-dependent oxidoreductase [Labilibaculum filiforme]PKQ61031.1 FAD-binding dehydrogenase [Labilibaculum filiforme]